MTRLASTKDARSAPERRQPSRDGADPSCGIEAEPVINRIKAYITVINWRKAGAALSIALVLLVWFILYRLLRNVSWMQVREAMGQVSAANAGLAFAATAASYAALAGYDVLALRQVGASQISLRFAAFTSFIAQAFTFTLGFSLLTGGFVRLRLYESRGVRPARIIAVGLLCTATFWLGLAAATGISLVLAPRTVAELSELSPAFNFLIGFSLLAALAAWIVYTGRKQRFLQIGSLDLRLPGPKVTLLSILIGLADTAAASLALWLLIPGGAGISYPAFLIIFTAATLIGMVSNVPGGVGVFETVILLALRNAPQADVVAPLLLFRGVYYLVPFIIAASLFAIHEARALQRWASPLMTAASAAKPFIPAVTAAAVFATGFMLLVSGALPALQDRMAILRRTIPLSFVETSHFLSSVIGALLFVVAYGLQQKLRSAWRAAIILLGSAIVLSLAKGIDYEESILCLAVVALLWFGGSEFYRKGGFLDAETSPEWLIAAFMAAGASIWIGAVIYHNNTYLHHIWWDFTYRGDEPRFLRASLGIAAVFLILLSYRFLHKPASMREPAAEEELKRARPIIASSPKAEAHLANLGDKRLLFNKMGDGFIMYGVMGRSWIAMGDPIAPNQNQVAELVWQFKELVDRHRGVPVFYQATTACLPAYLDAGFSMAKLGEEAWVDLSKFTLDGKDGRRIRQTKAAAERSEATVEVVPAADIEPLMPELKRVSNAWLKARGGAEKGFSLGFWSEPYLRHYDHAIIRHFGEIVAFANIWKSANKEEYSVDLMRHSPGAPPGMMDLLFISLMEQAKVEGFHWFNLGMAPLSGLPDHRLASRWSRFATFVFRYGDRFYNFSGLRSFKNKFKPDWRPRYLVYPGGTLGRVLVDVTALIARSPARVVPARENN